MDSLPKRKVRFADNQGVDRFGQHYRVIRSYAASLANASATGGNALYSLGPATRGEPSIHGVSYYRSRALILDRHRGAWHCVRIPGTRAWAHSAEAIGSRHGDSFTAARCGPLLRCKNHRLLHQGAHPGPAFCCHSDPPLLQSGTRRRSADTKPLSSQDTVGRNLFSHAVSNAGSRNQNYHTRPSARRASLAAVSKLVAPG